MNPPDDPTPPPSTLELIDLAVTAAKRAAHSCHNDTAREHFEYALMQKRPGLFRNPELKLYDNCAVL